MATLPDEAVRKLPWWVPVAGSAAVAFHLLAVLTLALAAQSGPWPSFMGPDFAVGPEFATRINNLIYPVYLRPLGMTHNYHFLSDRTAVDGVSFEVILRNEEGVEIDRLKFPNPSANFWVYHRQKLLAQGLGNDAPVPQRGPEKVALKGAQVPKVDYWLGEKAVSDLVYRKDKDGKFLPPLIHPAKMNLFPKKYEDKKEYLVRVTLPEDHELPPGAAMSRPSPWSLILAKSYMRYLCGKHGAFSAELIRYSRPAVLPPFAIMAEPPREAFTVMIVHFGDLKLDFEEVKK